MAAKPLPDALAREALEAWERHGRSPTKVAKEFGIALGTVEHRLRVAKLRGMTTATQQREATHGHAPEHDLHHSVPEPFVVRGYSSYYNKDGVLAGQWVKTKLDDSKFEAAVREWIKSLVSEVDGISPLTMPPAHVLDDLLTVYPLGDPHIGMYAWSEETGNDFDLDIARRQLFGAIDRLVSAAPASSTAIILPVGDVFHADNQTNVTPGHKHQLDVDTRYVKVLSVGIASFRHIILRALEKHQKVMVRFVGGNHDPHSIWALAMTIEAYFSNEPRVTVDLSPAAFWFYRFGSVLIGSTHGDKTKTEALLGVMATDRAKDWGETKYRYWYTGHIHNSTVKELPGVVCESFRTLAARDAYAAGAGYRAGRDMLAIVHHRDYGEIERHRCDIGMLTSPSIASNV